VASQFNEKRVDELITVLAELKGLHDELLVVLRAKLDAMRRADAERMQSCGARERFLAERIRQREGLRRQLAEIVADGLGLHERVGAETAGRQAKPTERRATEAITVSRLAERIGEPRRTRLTVLAAQIREAIEQVDRVNRVVALVAMEMAEHFRRVREVMISAGIEQDVYLPTGTRARVGVSHVIDAVG